MRITLRIALVILFFSFLMVRPTSSYAYWHGHVWVGVGIPGPYYYGYPYSYGPYYDSYYYAPEYVVSTSNYQPVVVNGMTYYVNNGIYYVYTQYGYQAVATPVGASVVATAPVPVVQAATTTVTTASESTDDSISINIPNNKGGYTAVILKRSGNGFVGPQGEFYAEFPKVSQLQLMYGK